MPAAIARARRERADRSTYFATTGATSARSPGSDSEERPGRHRCSSAAGAAASSAHRFSLSSSGPRADVAGVAAAERSEPTTPSTSSSAASGAMAQKPLAAPPFAAAAASSSVYPQSARQRWQCPSASVGLRQPTDDACSGDQPQQRGIARARNSEAEAEARVRSRRSLPPLATELPDWSGVGGGGVVLEARGRFGRDEGGCQPEFAAEFAARVGVIPSSRQSGTEASSTFHVSRNTRNRETLICVVCGETEAVAVHMSQCPNFAPSLHGA